MNMTSRELGCIAASLVSVIVGCGQEPQEGERGFDEPSEGRWRYEGQVNWSNEHAVGDECGSMLSNGTGSGEFVLQPDEVGTSRLRFVGVGCQVTLQRVDGGTHDLVEPTCDWGEWPGLRFMQVTRMTFDRFELDLALTTLNYDATIERSLPDGTTVERCERAELMLRQIVE